MCGIAGIFSLKGKPINGLMIKGMCDIMAHRGPDDRGYALISLNGLKEQMEGWWREYREEHFIAHEINARNSNLALGHVRLAIIDLTDAAHQPMASPDKSIWLTYNGEIYNFKELRQQLSSRGYSFVSQSDTEVLLHLYMEEGPALIEKLNGIFAFAIWDNQKKMLMLARDRYGVKPLYYAVVKDTLLFASEIKGILMYKDLKAEVNLAALSEYFTFQNAFGTSTLFKDINIIKPGHFILVKEQSPDDYQLEEHKYWEFHFKEEEDKGEEYYISGLREIINSSVSRQLVSDVPLGIYLSGGMDSNAIAALSAPKYKGELHAFTVGYEGRPECDERDKAKSIAKEFGLPFHEIEITPDGFVNSFPELVNHCDGPIADIAAYGYFSVMKEARKNNVPVMLTGFGGDELFWGYPWVVEAMIENANKLSLCPC